MVSVTPMFQRQADNNTAGNDEYAYHNYYDWYQYYGEDYEDYYYGPADPEAKAYNTFRTILGKIDRYTDGLIRLIGRCKIPVTNSRAGQAV